MSIQLPLVDLSTASKGTTGTITLSPASPTSNAAWVNKPATLQVYNDSGCGLRLSYRNTGGGADLPAGAWKNLRIDAGELYVDYSVVYFMANAPVTTLLATYYGPTETPDAFGQLGNSPIGLSSNVPLTATATAVANDGNPAATEFVEASIGGVKHVHMTNDGFLELLRDTTPGNLPVQEWKDVKAGGKDYNFFLMQDGTMLFQEAGNGAFGLRLFPNGSISRDAGTIASDGTGVETFSKALGGASQAYLKFLPSDQATFQWFQEVGSNGNWLLVDNNSGTTELNVSSGAPGGLKLSGIGNFTVAWSRFTGTTTGTYSHGLGTTPNVVAPNQHAVGSSSFGWDSETSTQVHITNFNGAAFVGEAKSLV